MTYKWKDSSYKRFTEAANAWLQAWAMEEGCAVLAKNLKMWIRVETPEEWKEMALTNVEEYHCGNCDLAIPRIQQKMVKQLFESIEKV